MGEQSTEQSQHTQGFDQSHFGPELKDNTELAAIRNRAANQIQRIFAAKSGAHGVEKPAANPVTAPNRSRSATQGSLLSSFETTGRQN
jgi:hypothetical protein